LGRLTELLGDTHLPILAKANLLESIRMNEIQLPPEEKESIFDVLRREGEERGRREGEERGRREGEERGRKEGEERGRKEGEERGRRRALLDLAARLLPKDSADLAGITDVTELGLVIEQRLSGRGEG
jgi:flagellar biosynthesis/type III secretory pathway protein FliH